LYELRKKLKIEKKKVEVQIEEMKVQNEKGKKYVKTCAALMVVTAAIAVWNLKGKV